MNKLKIGSCFTGIGAWEKAFEYLGIDYDLKFFCEFDKYPVKSYIEMFNEDESKNLGDITKANIENLPDIDVFCYSPPCQAFSIAGKQLGFEDKRGILFFESLKIIQAKKPKYCLMENVKGLTTKKFNAEFQEMLKALEETGYKNHWKVLNTKDYGLPQNRERVFVISIRNDIEQEFEFPVGFDNGIRLKDILESEVDEKYYIAQEKCDKLIQQFLDKGQDFSYCIDANYWKGTTPEQYLNKSRRQLVTVPNVLRPVRTEYGKEIRKQYENGEIQESRHNMTELQPREDGISNTLTTVQKDNLVCIPCITPDRVEKRQNGRRFKEDGELMFTLTSQDRHGILCIDDTQGFDGIRFYNDQTPTLRAKRSGLKVVEENEIKQIGMLDIKGNESIRRVYDEGGDFP